MAGRLVGADRDRGQVERPQPLADLLEVGRVVPGVAAEEEATIVAGHRPAAPEPAVHLEARAGRPVLHGHAGQRDPALLAAVPPVELDDVGDAEIGEPRAQPERHVEARPVRLGQPLHRGLVQVVVVIVRDQHDVDGRQILEAHAGRRHPLGAGERQRAGALRPLRIGEDVHAGELDQQRRVADPGDGGLGLVRAQRHAVAGDGRQLEAPGGKGGRPHAPDEERGPRPEGRPAEVGIGVGEAVLAMVGGRARDRAADAARAAHGEEADDERERGPTPAAGAG